MRSKSAQLLFTLCLLAVAALSQNIRGTILGTVRDPSGAVVRGAKITVRHIATGLVREETTNDAGEYLFAQLPVGQYNLTAEQTGFKKVERQNVLLQVDDKLRVDLDLTVGAITETVAVEAAAPVIQTDSATVGNVVDNKKVTELPLNGRNFLQLNLLVPGANQGVKGSQNQTQGGSITVNGAREQANNFLLDGVDNNDLAINQYSVAISTEAIQEFKVQASTYSSEFGRSGGAQINIATKSGTNQFHGVLYEYLRNADLDAKNFFDRPALPIPPFKRNQFGASVGGPVIKDRTFFFFNWESTRVRQSITRVATVPTTAMKNGDFSALLPNTIIYNPGTLSTSGGQPVRTPFDTNRIPKSLFTGSIGQAIANLYPDPNGATGPGSGLFTSSPGKTDDFNQYNSRVDHRFTQNDSVFVRYSFIKEDRFDTFDPFCSLSNVPGFGCNTLNGGQNAVVSHIHLFGATRVNELRLGFNRTRGGIFQQDRAADVSTQLGILGTSRSPIDFGLVRILPAGFDSLGDGGNLPQDRKDNTYQISDAFTWTHGTHTYKFGGDFRRFQLNLLFDSNARGSMNFDPFYTTSPVLRGANIGAGTGGNPIAELLLGVPDTASVSRSIAGPTGNTVTAFRTYSLNYFVQDDWRIRPNLTLNLGLRWEYNSPVVDKYNHLGTFDPGAPGQLRVSTSQKPELYEVSKKQFAPRIGFAYTPFGSKTVFRGGYGIFWDDKLLNIHLTPALSPPFLVPLNFNQSTNGVPNINIANPFGGQAGAAAVPSAVWLESPFKNGYLQQWSLNVQRELPSAMAFTIGYVGSKGTHLDHQYNANLPQPSTLFVQANRPYPNFGNLTVDSASASSIYHALQTSIEKRFSQGLSFLVGYTYSKAIDNGSAWNAGVLNVFNFHAERGLSTFDTRNRFVGSYTYDLPFGKGRPYGANWSGVANVLLGGWQTNGILTIQSGNPFDVQVGLNTITGTNSGTRPDVTGNPNDFHHDPQLWFNTLDFNRNFSARFGNAGRNVVIGPGTKDFDFALLKRFPLFSEQRYLQFRSEFFNLANHPNFDNPNATLVSPSFGRVTSAGTADPRSSSRQIQFALRLVF
ncbi:MAG TPA: carboxypeptidase regulatory-like domain-containing protein [Bryobacteraceae bacterium]|nr:carboxypeptidase regulatory-like domain-containing protein [Bryobacteraceae bacterium]